MGPGAGKIIDGDPFRRLALEAPVEVDHSFIALLAHLLPILSGLLSAGLGSGRSVKITESRSRARAV